MQWNLKIVCVCVCVKYIAHLLFELSELQFNRTWICLESFGPRQEILLLQGTVIICFVHHINCVHATSI